MPLLKKLYKGRELFETLIVSINIRTCSCRKNERKAMQMIRGDYVNLLSMKRKSPWQIVVKAKNDERIMHILLPMQKGKNYRLAIIVTISHNSTSKIKKKRESGF